MVEFDLESGKKNIIYEFSINNMVEATGSDVLDKDGNIYFAGRRMISDEKEGSEESVISQPFMIKFNPDRPVK
jgi:hypothetical protein